MQETGPLNALVALLADGVLLRPGEAAAFPRWPGAYVLLLGLETGFALAQRHGERDLAPGWYAYCGSAHGPGGVGARLGRHFRKDKPLRWHIDALSLRAATMAALAFPGGDECALRRALAASGRFSVPVTGFGSSDCRTCPAHLLRWTGG